MKTKYITLKFNSDDESAMDECDSLLETLYVNRNRNGATFDSVDSLYANKCNVQISTSKSVWNFLIERIPITATYAICENNITITFSDMLEWYDYLNQLTEGII